MLELAIFWVWFVGLVYRAGGHADRDEEPTFGRVLGCLLWTVDLFTDRSCALLTEGDVGEPQ